MVNGSRARRTEQTTRTVTLTPPLALRMIRRSDWPGDDWNVPGRGTTCGNR